MVSKSIKFIFVQSLRNYPHAEVLSDCYFDILMASPPSSIFRRLFSSGNYSWYDALGYKMSEAFDKKWFRESEGNIGEELLASADHQQLPTIRRPMKMFAPSDRNQAILEEY